MWGLNSTLFHSLSQTISLTFSLTTFWHHKLSIGIWCTCYVLTFWPLMAPSLSGMMDMLHRLFLITSQSYLASVSGSGNTSNNAPPLSRRRRFALLETSGWQFDWRGAFLFQVQWIPSNYLLPNIQGDSGGCLPGLGGLWMSAGFCLGRWKLGRTGWAGWQDEGISKSKSTQPQKEP